MERLALTPEEAAESIGVCVCTMRSIIRQPGFPAMKIGTRWVIPVKPFAEWLDEQCRTRQIEPNNVDEGE